MFGIPGSVVNATFSPPSWTSKNLVRNLYVEMLLQVLHLDKLTSVLKACRTETWRFCLRLFVLLLRPLGDGDFRAAGPRGVAIMDLGSQRQRGLQFLPLRVGFLVQNAVRDICEKALALGDVVVHWVEYGLGISLADGTHLVCLDDKVLQLLGNPLGLSVRVHLRQEQRVQLPLLVDGQGDRLVEGNLRLQDAACHLRVLDNVAREVAFLGDAEILREVLLAPEVCVHEVDKHVHDHHVLRDFVGHLLVHHDL
mmetsp:Transcript_52385/g.170007  ORF Transcript_52385/g.170007 Transcript_52385/m.170007 type:complete len:253 (+) Transcript_52385:185-943(+)|eukprot:CAMPEP_0204189066 /NCGR_PEP_ID=MMETSP0361-20130328/58160_1 /ASSEMBLY_ACC=CAM_ASM_000343 /TAXON_ID=268821 /ORGANISM="Scrippsiella Hangoei, Strain SHTV-5" /LENGTH=252 /DNA_ID=CAMNT_0051149701 /DNA_START=98 /DNA_END=856 /DNA_ORIENTATION=+